MTIKYGTDEYGNVWHDTAQIEPVGGTVCYNPEKETLVEPPEVPEGKRLKVENGNWKILVIDSSTIKDGDRIRPKTEAELITSGIKEAPKGMKVVDLVLVQKTLEEQLSSKEITQAEYNEIKNRPLKSELEMIDVKSIRGLREWISKQSGCPEFLKEYELESNNKRKLLKV